MKYIYEYKANGITDWYAANNKDEAATEVDRIRDSWDTIASIKSKLRRLTKREELTCNVIDIEDYCDDCEDEEAEGLRENGYKVLHSFKEAKETLKNPDIIATTDY